MSRTVATRLPVRLLLLVALGSADLLLAPPAAAAPAQPTCSATEVLVLVQPGPLDVQQRSRCVPADADSAAQAFENAGAQLTYVAQQPGFLCRVDGAPADDPCVRTPPGDAYWGLFVTESSGSWTYASLGIRSLPVPDGGGLALVWQGSTEQTLPRDVAPTPTGGGSDVEDPTDADATDGPEAGSPSGPASGTGGLPGWVVAGAAVGLFGAAGGVALTRRRKTGP